MGRIEGPCEALTYKIIGVCMTVHNRIGPGEKEAVYQRALELDLQKAGLGIEPQKNLPVYDGDHLLGYYIPDFIVEEKVILEIKAFTEIHQKYLGQIITYLNHTGLPVGLLVNFGGRSLIYRRVLPSPQISDIDFFHQWLFVPDWLKSQKHDERTD